MIYTTTSKNYITVYFGQKVTTHMRKEVVVKESASLAGANVVYIIIAVLLFSMLLFFTFVIYTSIRKRHQQIINNYNYGESSREAPKRHNRNGKYRKSDTPSDIQSDVSELSSPCEDSIAYHYNKRHSEHKQVDKRSPTLSTRKVRFHDDFPSPQNKAPRNTKGKKCLSAARHCKPPTKYPTEYLTIPIRSEDSSVNMQDVERGNALPENTHVRHPSDSVSVPDSDISTEPKAMFSVQSGYILPDIRISGQRLLSSGTIYFALSNVSHLSKWSNSTV